MNSSILNFCQSGGCGMSLCIKAGKNYEVQKQCSFCDAKATGGDHCLYEVYGTYCYRLSAQKHSQGQPVLLKDISDHDSLKGIDECKKPTPYGSISPDYSGSVSRKWFVEIIINLADSIKIYIHNNNSEILGISEKGLYQLSYDLVALSSDVRGLTPENVLGLLENGNLYHLHRYPGKREFYEMFIDDIKTVINKLRTYLKRKIASRKHHELKMKVPPYRDESRGMRRTKKRAGRFLRSSYFQTRPEQLSDCNCPSCRPRHDLVIYSDVGEPKMIEKHHDHEKEAIDKHIHTHLLVDYLHSRYISIPTIQERYEEGLMVVVPSISLESFYDFDEDCNLLFDKECYVFYDKDGELQYTLSRKYLKNVLHNWEKMVPESLLPEKIKSIEGNYIGCVT